MPTGGGRGRDTLYKPEYCEEIVAYFQERLNNLGKKKIRPELPTFEKFSAHLGIAVQTLYNWAEKHPEFMEAKKKASTIQHACLIDGALGDDFASGPAIFAMKNLMKWTDKSDVNVGGQPDNPLRHREEIVPDGLDDEEREMWRKLLHKVKAAQRGVQRGAQ